MEHLSAEALARLVDDLPATDERRHLETCDVCQRELEALRAQAEALSRLPDVRPPRGDWEALEARLLSEGLIDGGSRAGYGELARTPGWMRGAAAVLLFLAGTAAGAAGVRGGLPGFTAMERPTVAAMGPGMLTGGSTGSVEDAAMRVRLAERGYIDALATYRELVVERAGEPLADDPTRRYAALEVLVQAGRAAVREAPADPFLNGFLASALAEQQAVVRRISSGSDDYWF